MPNDTIEVKVARIDERTINIVALLLEAKERDKDFDRRITTLEGEKIKDGDTRLRKVEDFMGKVVAIAGCGVFLMGIIQFVISKYF